VTGAAAVREVAVHGMSQVRPLDEVTEGRDELRPVGDQRRGIEWPLGGKADEGCDGRAHAFDRAGPGLHLLDINAWGQVVRHGGLLERETFEKEPLVCASRL